MPPFDNDSVIVATVASNTRPAATLLKSDDSAMALISSDFPFSFKGINNILSIYDYQLQSVLNSHITGYYLMSKASRYLILFLLIFVFVPFTWAVEYSETCGKEWEWVNPLPQGDVLTDVAWSPELKQYVAIGSGSIIRSVDGEVWKAIQLEQLYNFNSIAWNGSMWIVVGWNGVVFSSTDGVNWQEQASNTNESLHSVFWNGQQWLSVGYEYNYEISENSPIILSSLDGINWQKKILSGKGVLNDVHWSNHQWIAVGSVSYGTPLILSSTDGINWQEQLTDVDISNATLNDVNWNGSYWVAVGNSGTIFSSIDGKTWQQYFYENNYEGLESVSWNGLKWIIAGSHNSMITSTDSINWQRQVSTIQNWVSSIIWTGQQWLAVGTSGYIGVSIDGLNWQAQSIGERSDSYGNSYDLNSIFWNGQGWMSVGQSGAILSSNNGIDWIKQISGTWDNFNAIAWGDDQWIAVGDNGIILSSRDGITWQEQDSGVTTRLNALAWNGNKWIAVGNPEQTWDGQNLSVTGTSSTLITSADGINWEKQIPDTTQNLNDVFWNGQLWMVVGGTFNYGTSKLLSVIFTSTDGNIWEKQQVDGDQVLVGISWGKEMWVVASSYNYFLTSTDAVNWHEHYFNSGSNLIDIAWNGAKWLAIGGGGYIVSSIDAITWKEEQRKTSNSMNGLAWDGNQWIMVGGSVSILSSICYPRINFNSTRAIIVAGGGNPNDPLQPGIDRNANLAYQTLRQRGISSSNIKYFNTLSQDADNDGVIDTESSAPTKALIESTIKTWAAGQVDNQTPLLVYLVDHGGDNIFYINKPTNDYAEVMKASEFSSWLDTLQESSGARVTLVYDACNSGSFMDELQYSPVKGFDRISIFSAEPSQSAYFGAKGALSFSGFFWNNIGQGMDVRAAHRSATVAVRAVTQNDGKSYQTTVMDDNGDGEDNYIDGALARDTYLGVDNNKKTTYPSVVKHQGSTTIDISQDGKLNLFARVDLPKDQIERVWAVVIPPDSNTTGSEAITELPVIELNQYNAVNGHYEASSTLFKQSGQYTVSYYAKTKKGVNSRFPIVSLITVTDSGYQALEQKDLHAILVVGGQSTDSLHKAATNNANLAYQTLRNRGVNRNNIYYLNHSPQDADGDGKTDTQAGSVTSNKIKEAITDWAQSKVNSTTPLLIYLIGDGSDKEFILSSSETLSADTLSSWVNELQSKSKARVTFIYDAPESGSFMSAMASSDKNHERINLFSTQAGQGAYYGADGQLSFSYFFWSNTARGLDVRKAFLNTRRTLSTATRSLRSAGSYQQAQMDDNGDGKWDSHGDGDLAKVTHLGLNAATASSFPVIFEHQVSALNSDSIRLSAKVDLPPELIKKVWVLINTPEQSITSVNAISQLPEIELTYNAQNKTFEGSTPDLTQTGDYTLTYYAQSTQSNISEPVSSIVQVDNAGQSSLFQCATLDSDANIILACLTAGQQAFQASLTLPQNSNSILWQLNTISINQSATNNSQCTTIDNQANLQINCLRIGDSDYKISLNFFHKDQQFWWEFGELIGL